MSRRARGILAIGAALVVAVGLVVAVRLGNRVPFGPDQIAPTGSLSLVSYRQAQDALGDGVNATMPEPGNHLVLGRVAWWPPPPRSFPAHAQFVIVVLDKRNQRRPATASAVSADQHAIGIASDVSLDRAEQQYEWLRGAGATRTANGWAGEGVAVYVSSPLASPVTLVAHFPMERVGLSDGMPTSRFAPVAMEDVILALVFTSADGEIYWAVRLAG